MEEDVYRAIADPTRRALMDELFQRDGQTQGELEERFDMSRVGVMKHLRVLEEAHLVVTRR
ncbi:MAG TPA: helix-turn-helix domain-containing protein, partial [Acidimicrobiales bacterium]|nr:helix-turn-helix domain-containing protein [Acidimicrobiales bacterium]